MIIHINTLTDWIVAIGSIIAAIGGIAIPFILVNMNKKDNKKNSEFLAIERTAKLHSFLVLDNDDYVEFKYDFKQPFAMKHLQRGFNILNFQNEELEKEDIKILQIEFCFKNLTSILPQSIMIDCLHINFDSTKNSDYVSYYFQNRDELFKPVFISQNKIEAIMFCTFPNEIYNKLELSSIDSLTISVNIYFKNIFNIITKGHYTLSFEKDVNNTNNTILDLINTKYLVSTLKSNLYVIEDIYEENKKAEN